MIKDRRITLNAQVYYTPKHKFVLGGASTTVKQRIVRIIEENQRISKFSCK